MSSEQQEVEVSRAILKALEDSLKIQSESLKTQYQSLNVLMEVLEVSEHSRRILRKIAKDLEPEPTLTAAIAVLFTGDNTVMANNALSLNVGQTSQASIATFLADGVSASGGTVSAVTFTFSDPSATVVANADGLTATVTGVAASTGAVSGSVACTVTDTDGVVSTWTQAFTVTTGGGAPPPPPPSQLTQSVAVAFSTPTP